MSNSRLKTRICAARPATGLPQSRRPAVGVAGAVVRSLLMARSTRPDCPFNSPLCWAKRRAWWIRRLIRPSSEPPVSSDIMSTVGPFPTANTNRFGASTKSRGRAGNIMSTAAMARTGCVQSCSVAWTTSRRKRSISHACAWREPGARPTGIRGRGLPTCGPNWVPTWAARPQARNSRKESTGTGT